jgi:hypothetical protein
MTRTPSTRPDADAGDIFDQPRSRECRTGEVLGRSFDHFGWVALRTANIVHRASSEVADLFPTSVISWLNRRPGADFMLLGPRTSRAVIDAQHPDRPWPARVPIVTPRTVLEAVVDEVALGFLKGTEVAERADFVEAIEAGALERDQNRTPREFCAVPAAPRAVLPFGEMNALRSDGEHLIFPSRFSPPLERVAATPWADYRPNASVHLFLLRHAPDSPWVINVHGFRQGRPADLILFRSKSVRERFGVNVLHPILPLSGPRMSRGAPSIPGTDHTANVIALAQAAWDLRRTIRWIRASSDAPIVLHGVSLGAYVVSLVAGLDDVAAVIAGLPVVDYPAIMRRHAQRMNLPDEELALVEREELDALYRPVSPLELPPRVPVENRFIYAGKIDQISSSFQARALWKHWGKQSIHWFGGGHLGGALWDRSVKRYIDDALESALASSTGTGHPQVSA